MARSTCQHRVVDYIPEFGTHGKEVVTVEQVMLHTSGFPGEILLAPGADRDIRLAAFADWKLDWEPGTRFEYHGVSAHWVLAELIERTSGLDFRDFVEQRVTTPLGLPACSAFRRTADPSSRRSSRWATPTRKRSE